MTPIRSFKIVPVLVALLAPSLAWAQLVPPPDEGESRSRSDLREGKEPLSLDIFEVPLSVIPDGGAPVMTLDELLSRAEAVNGNTDLVVLREQVIQADNNVRRAWAGLLPQLTAAATYTRNSHAAVMDFPIFEAGLSEVPTDDGGTTLVPNVSIPIEIQQLNNWNANITASMPLLLMPAYFGIAAANEGTAVTEQNVTFARNELVLGITQAYYGAVASRRLIEVSYAQVQVQTEQERVAQARFEVGEVPKVDSLRAAVARTQAEQDLIRAQNAYSSAKLALQQLTGVNEAFDVVAPPPVDAPQGNVDELIRTGLESRKDLAASESAVALAKRALQSNYWQFAPVISAQGMYNWANVSGFSGSNSSWLVAITASINIFDGGTRYANLRDARSQRRQAEAQALGLRRKVREEVETALLDLESARANLISAQEQVRLANEFAELVQAQYDAGVATYLDVTDAYNARFVSQVTLVNTELNVQVASLQLSRAIGRFGVDRFP